MRTFQEIRDNYRFSDLEAETLKGLLPVVEPHAPQLIRDFYNLFLQIPDAAKFLQDDARLARLEGMHRDWLLGLFQGPYDERYCQRLQRVGLAHVNIGISAHFVHVGLNFLRQQLSQIVDAEVEPKLRGTARLALDKILDLIGRAYRDEEMRQVSLSFKLDNALVRLGKRFTFGLHLVVLLGLIALSLGVLAVLASDIVMIFQGKWEAGMVASLGTLLILWLMIELLEAEIQRIQGADFKFNLFVGVALVAFIRKILVASLTHTDLKTELMYLGGILILGVIFWLVTKAETKRG
jgi:uncharacterized membrane protein (DUF373 family)